MYSQVLYRELLKIKKKYIYMYNIISILEGIWKRKHWCNNQLENHPECFIRGSKFNISHSMFLWLWQERFLTRNECFKISSHLSQITSDLLSLKIWLDAHLQYMDSKCTAGVLPMGSWSALAALADVSNRSSLPFSLGCLTLKVSLSLHSANLLI